jgi:hypothetical protein
MWFLLLTVVVALVGIAAFLAILMKLWRRGKVGKVITAAVSAGVFYLMYTALYPTESFYKREFQKITGLPFPSSGSFLFKEASYPDIHGDYDSCALVQVSDRDYGNLRSKMRVRKSAMGAVGTECMQHLVEACGACPVLAESSTDNPGGEYSYWALVGNRSAVIINYVSW